MILFIIITYTQFKNSESLGWLVPILIGIFIFYTKYNPEPFADFKAFQNINIDGKENPEPINLNTYAEKRDDLKKDVLKKMEEYLHEIKKKRNNLE